MLLILRSKKFNFFFFDGRKDQTLVNDGSKVTQKVEEHVTLISEPGSIYCGHISPTTSTAKSIRDTMMEHFSSNRIDISNLKAIGCDGTAVNTGNRGGVISLLESSLDRPLQWIICLLHFIELPLRHLFKFVDGSTHGPSTFTGPIGKLLCDCQSRSVRKFEPIPTHLEGIRSENLSNDQFYLFEIVSAVSNGTVSDSLANKSPGKLCHARWMTTANRILRTYVSEEDPSDKLVVLAKFVSTIYAPIWFSIKCHSNIEDGSRHFLSLIQRTRTLPELYQQPVIEAIKRNAFFGHPENVILSLLCDNDLQTRRNGLSIIEIAREWHPTQRLFAVPPVNLKANSLYELLDTNFVWSPPPILRHVSLSELRASVEDATVSSFFAGVPCHSQSVERAVKIVSESSKSVCGYTRRNKMILNTILSRKIH